MRPGGAKPVVVALPALGLGAGTFETVARSTTDVAEVRGVDLPGFGDAASGTGFSVSEMADHVVREIRPRTLDRWFLLGHGLGGKVVGLLAARAREGDPVMAGLAGVLLLAPSPPGPEPLSEQRRERMLGWVESGPLSEAAAREFVATSSGGPLPAELLAGVLHDLRRSAPTAWRAWLSAGSREDLGRRVGVLPLPAVILSGGADRELGPAVQRHRHGPVYPRARFRDLPGVGHLLPVESPGEVARAIAELVGG